MNTKYRSSSGDAGSSRSVVDPARMAPCSVGSVSPWASLLLVSLIPVAGFLLATGSRGSAAEVDYMSLSLEELTLIPLDEDPQGEPASR